MIITSVSCQPLGFFSNICRQMNKSNGHTDKMFDVNYQLTNGQTHRLKGCQSRLKILFHGMIFSIFYRNGIIWQVRRHPSEPQWHWNSFQDYVCQLAMQSQVTCPAKTTIHGFDNHGFDNHGFGSCLRCHEVEYLMMK